MRTAFKTFALVRTSLETQLNWVTTGAKATVIESLPMPEGALPRPPHPRTARTAQA